MSFCFLLRLLRLYRFIYPVQLFCTYSPNTLWLRLKRNNGNANDASDAMERSDLWQPGIIRYVQAIQNIKFNRKNAQKAQKIK